MKRRTVAYLFALLALPLLGVASCARAPLTRTAFALDTVVTVTLHRGGSEKTLDGCFALLGESEKKFSRTVEASEISALNRDGFAVVSPETAELIALGIAYGERTEGAFDISIGPVSRLWDFHGGMDRPPDASAIARALPLVGVDGIAANGETVTLSRAGMALDLGGIAKGYICDRMRDYLVAAGVESAIIDLGGDVALVGGRPDGTAFRVGIRDPFDGSKLFGTLSAKGVSVVTSGTYERYFAYNGKRYHHILDPGTGFPVENDVVSVTVIAPSTADADALSTACLVRGDLSLLSKGEEGILIRVDGTVETTAGIGVTYPFSRAE